MTGNRIRMLSEAVEGVKQSDESTTARTSVAVLLEYEKISNWLLQQPPGALVGITCFEVPEYDFRRALNVPALYLYEQLHTHVYVKESGWHFPRKETAETIEVSPIPLFCSWFVRLLNCMAAGQDQGQVDVSREVALEVLTAVKEMVDSKSPVLLGDVVGVEVVERLDVWCYPCYAVWQHDPGLASYTCREITRAEAAEKTLRCVKCDRPLAEVVMGKDVAIE